MKELIDYLATINISKEQTLEILKIVDKMMYPVDFAEKSRWTYPSKIKVKPLDNNNITYSTKNID